MRREPYTDALLALEDGQLFYGRTSGSRKTVCGEIVFNTALTGYQEVCTDPSYANQIVLFTTAHIGNVGVNRNDYESNKVWAKGLVVREMSKTSSNWRSEQDILTFLKENKITWIEGIDTRKLTRHIRTKGTKNACIMVGNIDATLAVQLAKNHVKAEGLDLSKTTIKGKSYQSFHQDLLRYRFGSNGNKIKTIYLYDFGVKANILRMLASFGFSLKVIPNLTPIEDVLANEPDGVIISNGPGDPASMQAGIKNIRKLIHTGIPVLGICLGCQLIALAAGGNTKKMKFGHHGTNHPVYDLRKQKVYITSQNHNFVVDETTLPNEFEITHVSLFDGSVQGIKSKKHPVIGFQGHPEGCPGPRDIKEVFEEFLQEVHQRDAIRSFN